MTIGRIRVLVAGDIYLNRSLVRPFLEDDGYEIVGEPLTREEILPAVNAQHPDAVVMDDRLLSSRGNGPEDPPGGAGSQDGRGLVGGRSAEGCPGVDAHLESGMSLAALSAILGGLFAAEDLARTAVGATAATATTGGRARAEHSSEPRGGVVRFVAAVGLPILVVWALIAIVRTGGGTPVPWSDTTDSAATS